MNENVTQELREENNQLIHDNKQLNEDIQKLTKLCALLESINSISINIVMKCKCNHNLDLIKDQLNQIKQKYDYIKSNNKTVLNIHSNHLNLNTIRVEESFKTLSDSKQEKTNPTVIKKKINRNSNVRQNQKVSKTIIDILKPKEKHKYNDNNRRQKYNKVCVVLKCDWTECDFETKSKKILRFHKMRHSGVKPFKCSWTHCNAMFRDKYELDNHKWRHTGEKQYNCCWPGCDKKFSCKSNLTQHIKLTHEQIKRFKCDRDDCGLMFADKYELKVHNCKAHNGEAPYQCDWPGCEFKTCYDTTLKNHKMRHTGEKLYKCLWPQCECSFRQNSHLKTHMLKHTGEKPWTCQSPNCDRRFQTKQSMKIHMNRNHKI